MNRQSTFYKAVTELLNELTLTSGGITFPRATALEQAAGIRRLLQRMQQNGDNTPEIAELIGIAMTAEVHINSGSDIQDLRK